MLGPLRPALDGLADELALEEEALVVAGERLGALLQLRVLLGERARAPPRAS